MDAEMIGFELEICEAGCFSSRMDAMVLRPDGDGWFLEEGQPSELARRMGAGGRLTQRLGREDALTVECFVRLAQISAGDGSWSTNHPRWREVFRDGSAEEGSSRAMSHPAAGAVGSMRRWMATGPSGWQEEVFAALWEGARAKEHEMLISAVSAEAGHRGPRGPGL